MPKSIIREFDNSTPGITLSSNFSVFVPGYAGDAETEESREEAKKLGIYFEDSGIYKLNSIAQFEKYIGMFGGEPKPKKAPVLEVFNPIFEDGSANTLFRYSDYLRVSQFRNVKDAYFYKGIPLEATDKEYEKGDGKLLKTFDLGNGNIQVIKFIRVSEDDLWDDLPSESEVEEGVQGELTYGATRNMYYKIKIGNEGNDEFAFGDSLGNQITYELLSLGYTVYFKVLDKLSGAAEQMMLDKFWAPLRNKSIYRIRYFTTGGVCDTTVAQKVANLVTFNNDVKIEEADTYNNETGRGDCIALLDINEELPSISGARTQSEILQAFGDAAKTLPASKYVALFAPRIAYKISYPKDSPYSANALFPCSFHYLACAIQAQERYAEWYAVAGYTRGISTYSIAYTTYNFGDVAINTLAPRTANTFTDRAINLILNERGSYYLWGNRTSELLDTKGLRFSHFLNIRQLCTTLKQVLFDATRQFTFDPNSDLLWINFVNAIRPTLENMKADQGIRAYKITKVVTDKKALLVAKIRIIPIEAIEDFDISVYLEDSLSGIVVATDEEEVAE